VGKGYQEVDGNDEALRRIETGEALATFGDSSTLQFRSRQRSACVLELVGEIWNEFDFGIAFRPDFFWSKDFNTVIWKFVQDGTRDATWTDALNRRNVCASTTTSAASAFGIKHMGGLFICLVVATIIALAVHFIHAKLSPTQRRANTSRLRCIGDDAAIGVKFDRDQGHSSMRLANLKWDRQPSWLDHSSVSATPSDRKAHTLLSLWRANDSKGSSASKASHASNGTYASRISDGWSPPPHVHSLVKPAVGSPGSPVGEPVVAPHGFLVEPSSDSSREEFVC